MRLGALLLLLAGFVAAKQPLVIVSVDGLDNRYLANADGMGLKIPNIRRLMREGQVSAGIIGAVPTITWPSHTTIITGADPVAHGILGNWRPPGDKFLDYSQIKVPTLLGAAHAAGLKIATIDWPVTVGAPVDWDIPEYFLRRRGGAMDTKSVESRTQPPNLFTQIAADNPSFAQEWMDDRTRTLAVVWILQHNKPDLLLVHLVDLDSEEHDNAPFTRESKAIVELTDEMIGQIVKAMPAGSTFALVSDHGFERVNMLVNLQTRGGSKGSNQSAPDGRHGGSAG
jgi:predicted AlkP superfamily pyrophosphatase or phosphodiesterase